jgi:peptide/nickel transport system permease protein
MRRSLIWQRAALVVLGAVVAVALAAPWLAPQGPFAQNLQAALRPPGPGHWLGTDQFGRDEWARVVFGARLTLEIAFSAVALGLVLGGALGFWAGLAGGWIDAVAMRLMDIVLAFPYLLIAIAVVSALGPGSWHAAFAIGVYLVPSAARLARSAGLEWKERDFVEAAYALGAGRWRVFRRHLLPNTLSTLWTFAGVSLGRAVIFDAALSFLGLGAQPPQPSWGDMINSGRDYLLATPVLTVAPGIAIVLTVAAFNFASQRQGRT